MKIYKGNKTERIDKVTIKWKKVEPIFDLDVKENTNYEKRSYTKSQTKTNASERYYKSSKGEQSVRYVKEEPI